MHLKFVVPTKDSSSELFASVFCWLGLIENPFYDPPDWQMGNKNIRRLNESKKSSLKLGECQPSQ